VSPFGVFLEEDFLGGEGGAEAFVGFEEGLDRGGVGGSFGHDDGE
jgi:hypothetical protein